MDDDHRSAADDEHDAAPDAGDDSASGQSADWGEAEVNASFSQRLQTLFRLGRKAETAADGTTTTRPYTSVDVAAEIGRTAAYINYWRNGTRTNPGIVECRKIEKVFGVSEGYLTVGDDDPMVARVEEQLQKLRKFQDGGVFQVAERMSLIKTPAGIEAVNNMIETVLKLEQQSVPDGADDFGPNE
ncbi:hypothetical protein [Alloactinosynnema sp. L-07]|uniref:helix-turn-helix domain-containing protein n=1 Tax=Alloactinosynnema sp. L-07 TaxID=1653480 RepID=UPI00065F0A57|nr:helix-turn-helix domain-containing protein [Alloactinosynnema sp. L-07]CRK57020.1 hypothetical protein [Alloactinosynnema sp. L-07]